MPRLPHRLAPVRAPRALAPRVLAPLVLASATALALAGCARAPQLGDRPPAGDHAGGPPNGAPGSAQPAVADSGATVVRDAFLQRRAEAVAEAVAAAATGSASIAPPAASPVASSGAVSAPVSTPTSAPATFVASRARGIASGRADLARRVPLPAAERRVRTVSPNGADTMRADRGFDREQYARIRDNPFVAVAADPRSTFALDVDRASYGNVRRFLAAGTRPPADAVRLEELVNYFPYTLPAPTGDAPLALVTEVMPAPWQPAHRLVRVALQARRVDTAKLPPSTLVFLVDVSGSMASPDKLPLAKQALRLLVDQLRAQDRVALVAYAGAAGLVLPPTSGREKARILEAIDRLESGGSTAGGEGLELAYRVAREARMPDGNTRVVLATDGDFNVGVSSDAELERLVERRRAEGTFLTVLGFGTGNYQDAKMQALARVGNGNHAYVDDLAEARKVLVEELGATLHVVAKDVKLQVEFNPAAVRAWRLLGYEDRLLRDEDFADDAKDAGDVGAGHTVTALYEVIPAGVTGTTPVRDVAPLRYGDSVRAPHGRTDAPARGARADELLFVQLRWKPPTEDRSRLTTHVVRTRDAAARVDDASADFRFAAAVAAWGMLLRDSEHRGRATPEQVLALARGALGADAGGHRAEFVRLVERWQALAAPVARRE